MKRLLILIVGALLIGFPSASFAQATKTANGKVTGVDAGSLTVRVADKDIVLVVDAKSDVITPGGSSRTREAKAAGKAGPTLVELVKVGQLVQVKYHEAGMHAATIRVLPVMPSASTNKALRAIGVVSNLSPTSLTVKGPGDEWTFVVDAETHVDSPGGGTMARQKAAAGTKPTITDVIATGDTVSVTYHEMDGAKHAAVVRVTKKAR
jgi:hypothetical protein